MSAPDVKPKSSAKLSGTYLETPGTIRILCDGSELVDPEALVPFQGAFKGMLPADREKLRRQLIDEGIKAAATVWRRKVNGKTTLYLLDGHQRQDALLSLRKDGWIVPAIPVNFATVKDEAEARRTVMSLASTYGRVNTEELSAFSGLAGYKLPELNQRFSFPDIDLNALVRRLGAEALAAGTEQTVPGRPEKPTTKPGEVWRLGAHRLLCGNAEDAAAVKALQSLAKPASLMVTDPPYGVEYDAAEQLNRIAVCVELDPGWCDVIVQRWEKLTGKRAERG